MTASTISATDIDVFRKLANPAIVDVQSESRVRKATNEMRQAMAKAALEPASPAHSTASSKKSHFQRAQEEAAQEAKASAPGTPMAWLPTLTRAEPERAEPERAEPERSGPERSEPERSERSERAEPEAAEPDREAESEDERAPPGSEAERLEKQSFLIELANLQQKGVQLSRQFTLRDSLAELEFELQKQTNNLTTRHNVSFMRDMLRIAINGIEIGNNRFGPFLSIDGWAESVTQDMSKYEHSLERLYKRYWRRSQMSPLLELGWLLVGSMVAWHFKSKFFGPPAQPAAKQAPAQAPPQAPSSKEFRRVRARPVLRPPTSLFGM
jgi:chemotaxis protein histidine kinase CheA